MDRPLKELARLAELLSTESRDAKTKRKVVVRGEVRKVLR
jgi:hypothetical protein